MKTSLSFLFSFILFFSLSLAQDPETEEVAPEDTIEHEMPPMHLSTEYDLQNQLVQQYGNRGAMVRTFDERYEGVKGSPYLLNDFLPGILVHFSGQTFDNLSLRYDLMKQEVAYVSTGMDNPLVVDARDLEMIILKDRRSQRDFLFKHRTIEMTKGREPQYDHFIDLYDQGSTLLVQPEKTFIKADYQGAFSQGQEYDEYRTEFAYFLRPKGQEGFQRVKLNNASLLKALSDQKKALKTFLKEQDMDINIDGEAVQLLKHYDELTE
jgi:hypothetical protein